MVSNGSTTTGGKQKSFSLGLSNLTASIRQSIGKRLQRHDSTFSVGSEYQYESSNDLSWLQGSALLMADCLGTGLLALPHDIHVLGMGFGLGFLILNLPINFYAGTILSDAAGFVENRQVLENKVADERVNSPPAEVVTDSTPLETRNKNDTYNTLDNEEGQELIPETNAKHHSLHHDTATFDFIGMTSALFHDTNETRWVMLLFYTNIFLVLGNYILVMSHAVTALLGEGLICIPQAGLLASTMMFLVCQLRTMANLGRQASIVSLSALLIVVLQCLYHSNLNQSHALEAGEVITDPADEASLSQKLSALGSIGFAVGSQKLFLNIRHELGDRSEAPKSLALCLVVFGAFYVGMVVLAGANPPSFLFDAIQPGLSRRVAGFFLWVHVVVSYAINSQAICSSMDRIFFHNWAPVKGMQDHHRWLILTGFMAVSAFLVANAVPFFKDLVAFIGALTSVPLTLLFPAVFHRKILKVPLWLPTMSSLTSYGLVAFSVTFMVAALIGSVDSIVSDWSEHTGGFFACN